MDSINNPKLILSGLMLVALSGGLFVLLNLTQHKTTIQSKAQTALVNVAIVTPGANSKILGLTQFRATADTGKPPETLSAVLQVDGKDSQGLAVAEVEGKAVISGKFDGSKYLPGPHTLEVFLYDKQSSPLQLLGEVKVSVTVIPP